MNQALATHLSDVGLLASCLVTPRPHVHDIVGCKVLRIINNEDQEAFGYKTLWGTNTVDFYGENKFLGHYIRM